MHPHVSHAQAGDGQLVWRFASPEHKRSEGTLVPRIRIPFIRRPNYATTKGYAPLFRNDGRYKVPRGAAPEIRPPCASGRSAVFVVYVHAITLVAECKIGCASTLVSRVSEYPGSPRLSWLHFQYLAPTAPNR